jgi:hypothetical protein
MCIDFLLNVVLVNAGCRGGHCNGFVYTMAKFVLSWCVLKKRKKIFFLTTSFTEAGLLNKSLHLAPALGVTKFGHTLLCYLSRTWIFNKPTFGI